MTTVHVSLGKRSYDIPIASGLLKRLPEILGSQKVGSKIFLVSDTTVFELFGKNLQQELGAAGFQVKEILIPEGEQHKNLETVQNIYTYLIAQEADRNSTLIALGGGVTGDIGGFAAATFLRGISYIQIPTTLLAQVDSSVGGKTGVNHQLGKNLIGAFYQPTLVCIDTDTLATLPRRELQSGLYEILKYGLIYDADLWEYLENHLEDILDRVPGVMEHVIGRCCEIKAEVVSADETETHLRRILNFGHTFGHALEAATRYQGFTHGEAIAYGMLAATRLSSLRGDIDAESCRRIEAVIHRAGPLPPLDGIATDEILEAMKRDKKRHHDRVVFVLLKKIGKTTMRDDISEELLVQTWERVKSESAAQLS
ncbi:MAG: 3-dehydroquinate synthase [Acidobacteriota bacterium]